MNELKSGACRCKTILPPLSFLEWTNRRRKKIYPQLWMKWANNFHFGCISFSFFLASLHPCRKLCHQFVGLLHICTETNRERKTTATTTTTTTKKKIHKQKINLKTSWMLVAFDWSTDPPKNFNRNQQSFSCNWNKYGQSFTLRHWDSTRFKWWVVFDKQLHHVASENQHTHTHTKSIDDGNRTNCS